MTAERMSPLEVTGYAAQLLEDHIYEYSTRVEFVFRDNNLSFQVGVDSGQLFVFTVHELEEADR